MKKVKIPKIPKEVKEMREDRNRTKQGGGGQDRERITGNKAHHPSEVRPTGPTVTSSSKKDADDRRSK